MKTQAILGGMLGAVALGGLMLAIHARAAESPPSNEPGSAPHGVETNPSQVSEEAGLAEATFAGGCFWCMEPPFDKLEGVVSTTSGYTGGHVKNPTYEEVSAGGTGHMESVQVVYDPEKISYSKLLTVFWHNVDPTDPGGQFCDRGEQYRTAIFYYTEEQRQLAEASKRELEESGQLKKPVVTEIRPATTFYPAEEYHQDYYEKNPIRYKLYRLGCGRDRVLERLWGKATD